MLLVKDLFEQASLSMNGPVPWNTAISETRPGVYVITLVEVPTLPPTLPENDASHWIADQEILYIGKATSLRDRLTQFYRHRHGDSSPHRGGQAIKLLTCALQVHWGTVDACEVMEDRMIRLFLDAVGSLPFANRKLGTSKVRAISP